MIVITGGAGFLGSNLLAGFAERGLSNIVICDILGTGNKWQNIAKHEVLNIIHPDHLFQYITDNAKHIEMIYHLGAEASTLAVDADQLIEGNFSTSLKLWYWCARHNVRFVYASSGATYGDGKEGFSDYLKADELKKLKPLTPQGWSKHVFDRRVLRMVESGGAKPPQWAGLKFFNAYGPNEYHKDDQVSVIYKVYKQVKAGGSAKLFKSENASIHDGEQSRDFVWAGDCVDVMLWLYDHPEANGLFNLGSGESRNFEQMAKAVFKAMNMPENIKYIEAPDAINEKYQYYTQSDNRKLREVGYDKPFTLLEDGVSAYVQQFLAIDEPYR